MLRSASACCLPDEVGGLALVGEPLQRLGEHDGHVAAVHLAEREVAVQTRGSRLERKSSVIFKLSNSASTAILQLKGLSPIANTALQKKMRPPSSCFTLLRAKKYDANNTVGHRIMLYVLIA